MIPVSDMTPPLQSPTGAIKTTTPTAITEGTVNSNMTALCHTLLTAMRVVIHPHQAQVSMILPRWPLTCVGACRQEESAPPVLVTTIMQQPLLYAISSITETVTVNV
jgi:hypothetical protein